MRVSSSLRDYLILLAGSASFGTAAIFIDLSTLTPSALALLRFLISSLILLLVTRTRIQLSGILYGVILGVHMLLFVESVRSTLVIDSTVLVSTSPIFSVVLARAVGIPVRRIEYLAVVMAVLGVILMQYPLQAGRVVGNVEALLSGLMVAIYTVALSKRKEVQESLSFTARVYFWGGVSLIPGVVIQGIGELNLPSVLSLAGLVALPTLLGHTSVIYLSTRIRPHIIEMFGLLEPVVATLLAALLFDQVPTLYDLIGSAVVVGSVLLVTFL